MHFRVKKSNKNHAGLQLYRFQTKDNIHNLKEKIKYKNTQDRGRGQKGLTHTECTEKENDLHYYGDDLISTLIAR